MSDLELKIQEKVGKMISNILGRRNICIRFRNWLLKSLFKGPKKEISHDWQVVNSFYLRAVEYHDIQSKVNSHYPIPLENLVQLKVYLDLAKVEPEFAQAWTYLNLADSVLPLVVDKSELSACTVRLASRDRLIPESMMKTLSEDMQKLLKKGKIKCSVKKGDRVEVYKVQELRALLWNSMNRKISLRISLWVSVGILLFLCLSVAVFIAEFLLHKYTETVPKFRFPFLFITGIGFFGGIISAFLTTRGKAVDITSYQTLKIYTVLRMLLGAAGSFVVFTALNYLGKKELIELVSTNLYAFLGTGIVAGFSEQLFVGTLEKMADKLEIIGKGDQEKAK